MCWKKGKLHRTGKKEQVTLVHKGGGKDRQDIVNHRPTAVNNVLAIIFRMIIDEKLKARTETHRY